MPIFMDIRIDDSPDFSIEGVISDHIVDLAVQHKFDVKHIKYWVNEDQKKVFCLMEGPNKEACHAVHEASHGKTASNIIEVSDDEYKLLLMTGKTKNDLAFTPNGKTDPGHRTFLNLNTIDFKNKFEHFTKQCQTFIEEYDGLTNKVPEGLLVSFINPTSAAMCAISIDKLLSTIPNNYEYRIALVTGNPVDETSNGLFELTKIKLNILGRIGSDKTICMDSQTKTEIEKHFNAPKLNTDLFKFIDPSGFVLLKKVDDIFNLELFDPDFDMEKLNLNLGLSKSRSYRKIKSVTGLSPNQFIQEQRLRHSLEALKQNTRSIAEIANDLGFASPTYFTRDFRKRFKILPTTFAKLHN